VGVGLSGPALAGWLAVIGVQASLGVVVACNLILFALLLLLLVLAWTWKVEDWDQYFRRRK
jgi:hypothetical protein